MVAPRRTQRGHELEAVFGLAGPGCGGVGAGGCILRCAVCVARSGLCDLRFAICVERTPVPGSGFRLSDGRLRFVGAALVPAQDIAWNDAVTFPADRICRRCSVACRKPNLDPCPRTGDNGDDPGEARRPRPHHELVLIGVRWRRQSRRDQGEGARRTRSIERYGYGPSLTRRTLARRLESRRAFHDALNRSGIS